MRWLKSNGRRCVDFDSGGVAQSSPRRRTGVGVEHVKAHRSKKRGFVESQEILNFNGALVRAPPATRNATPPTSKQSPPPPLQNVVNLARSVAESTIMSYDGGGGPRAVVAKMEQYLDRSEKRRRFFFSYLQWAGSKVSSW